MVTSGQSSKLPRILITFHAKSMRSYRPRLFTQLDRHFAYTVNSTVRYNKDANGPERKVSYSSDLSPFKERVPLAHTIPK